MNKNALKYNGVDMNKEQSLFDNYAKMIDCKDFDLCILGDGAVEYGLVRKNVEKENPNYWEEALQHAYFRRKALLTFQFYENSKIKLECIETLLNNLKLSGDDGFQSNVVELVKIINHWLEYSRNVVAVISESDENNQKSLLKKLDAADKINYNCCNIFAGNKYEKGEYNEFFTQLKNYEIPIEYIEDYRSNTHLHCAIGAVLLMNQYRNHVATLAKAINSIENTTLRKIPFDNNDNTWFMSLNWCNSDLNNPGVKNLIKIHGSCTDDKSMVLPTQELRDIVTDYHTKVVINNIGQNLLTKCTKLYIWGTSLTDYDVEVQFYIFNGLKSNHSLKEIVVVNTDKEVFNKVKRLSKLYKLNENIQMTFNDPLVQRNNQQTSVIAYSCY